MRATINFEVDVDRVQETMAAVAREELQPLHQAMDLLEVSKPQDLHQGISQALEILGAVATQLEQYRDMLTAFEKARFETILPQPVQTPAASAETLLEAVQGAKSTVASMKQFDDFLEKVSEEDPHDAQSEKG
jgi:hypothetical protein